MQQIFAESDEQRKRKLASMLQIPKCNLTEEQAWELIDCAVEFHAAFALDDGERGEAKGVEYVIDTANSQAICQISRGVPFILQDKITKMVQEMLKGGAGETPASG